MVITSATSGAYSGGVLAPNGDIHFVPYSANRGQKISSAGVVSTYSLVYTTGAASPAYNGGVLDTNGDIHFVPYSANRGQKISSAGVVSTYALVFSNPSGLDGVYSGGVLAPNGDVHFVPYFASSFTTTAVGQKVSAAGVVSTYALVYTTRSAYQGGVLAPNGDVHFVPYDARVGQKISFDGIISTYSLVYTGTLAYYGGVLAPNGDVHFVPFSADIGQKISAAGVVSTYSLLNRSASAYYSGGVLAPNGDLHFIPSNANLGQKLSFPTGLDLEDTTGGRDAVLIYGRPTGRLGNTITVYSESLTSNIAVRIPNENFTIGFRKLLPVGNKTSSYTLLANDIGKFVNVGIGGSVTIPSSIFNEGDVITIINNGTGNTNIFCSAITTAYVAGINTDVSRIMIRPKGVATIMFIDTSTCVTTGTIQEIA